MVAFHKHTLCPNGNDAKFQIAFILIGLIVVVYLNATFITSTAI